MLSSRLPQERQCQWIPSSEYSYKPHKPLWMMLDTFQIPHQLSSEFRSVAISEQLRKIIRIIFEMISMFSIALVCSNRLCRRQANEGRNVARLPQRQNIFCTCIEWPINRPRHCMLLKPCINTSSMSCAEQRRLHNCNCWWSQHDKQSRCSYGWFCVTRS